MSRQCQPDLQTHKCWLLPAHAHLGFDSDAEAAQSLSMMNVSPSGCIKASVASLKQEHGGLWSCCLLVC